MSVVRSRRIVVTVCSCAAAVASVVLVAAPVAGKPPQTIPEAAMTVPAPIGDSAAGAAVASAKPKSGVLIPVDARALPALQGVSAATASGRDGHPPLS
jgi:hypothetical protein